MDCGKARRIEMDKTDDARGIARLAAAVLLTILPALAAQSFRLSLPATHGPLLDKAAAIFTRRVNQRCGAASTARTVTIELRISSEIGPEGFSIANGPRRAIRVTGGDEHGVLYGLGKLFRTSRCEGGVFTAGEWRGTSKPAGSLRGVYLASHFGNFYEAAPLEELEGYVEDLALWGVNALGFSFPAWQYASYDDPAARSNLLRIRAMMRAAKSAGMQVGALVAPNQVFNTAPAELRAKPYPDDWGRRGFLGVNVCPSLPAGHEYLLHVWAGLLNQYRDIGLDFVTYWPYDEGGCGCPQCWPWGARGYVNICRDLSRMARAQFPRMKVVLSTWMFDSPPAGEWEGLTKVLAEDTPWANYIMADAHEDYPRYPLERGVPGGLPLLNFPEISMWGMAPWGGYGANPLPGHLQQLWNQVSGKVTGGLPYSEGIYEDLNKVIYSQFYWDPKRTAIETLREYAESEFSPAVATSVLRAVELLEANHRRKNGRFEKPPRQTREALELIRQSDRILSPQARHSWRWRILYLRALIDDELSNTGGKPQGPVLKDAFAELVRIYHAEHVHTNRVAPPPLLP
ncbi:MAG: hypothetical protein IPP47_16800 [Bryobacterales bacterium]|nr:hypothetical protein [Bryobacterales bacterium]